MELARLIGYRPRPGVAAGTYLAFTLEEAAGAPEQAVSRTTVPKGVQVRSVPGPGERPQTFETMEILEARLAWSVLRPRTARTVVPVKGDTSTYLEGTATNLKPGDAVLLVGPEREHDADREEWDFRRLTVVEPDVAGNRTRIEWAPGLGSYVPPKSPSAAPKIYALRLRASLFGYNAPDPRVLPNETRDRYTLASSGDWSFTITGQTIDLDSVYPGVARRSWLVLSSSSQPYQELYRPESVAEGSVADYAMSGKTTRLELDTAENLPQFAGGTYRQTAVFAQSERLEFADTPITEPVWGDEIVLDRVVEDLEAGRRLIVRGRRPRVTVAGGPLTLRSAADLSQTKTVPAGTTLLVLTEPGTATVSNRAWSLRDVTGADWTVSAPDSAFTRAAPATGDEVVAELATLKIAERADDGHTRLVLTAPLAHAYDRLATADPGATVVYANVAPATHGETVGEVLGSGDGSAPFQRFGLKQTPLTFVSAATASGTASSLEVRVDDVQWRERAVVLRRRAEGPRLRHRDGRRGPDHRAVRRRSRRGPPALRREQRARDVPQGHRRRGQPRARPAQPAGGPPAGCQAGHQPAAGHRRRRPRDARGGRAGARRSPCSRSTAPCPCATTRTSRAASAAARSPRRSPPGRGTASPAACSSPWPVPTAAPFRTTARCTATSSTP